MLYIEKGAAYGTVGVLFNSEGTAEGEAAVVRVTPIHTLVPQYMGKRNTRVVVRNLSNEVDPWLVVTFVAKYGRVVSAEVIRADMWSEG